LLPASAIAGSIEPVQQILVTVEFSPEDWRLEMDSSGNAHGLIDRARLSIDSIDATTLKRIRGLALCVATVREPAIPVLPILENPQAMPPSVLLQVRAKTGRGSVVQRRIRISPESLDKREMHVDVGPALLLLAEMRALVPVPTAYDYRSWLRGLLPRTSHVRCPWLDEPVGE
jgi:hypothetical protein